MWLHLVTSSLPASVSRLLLTVSLGECKIQIRSINLGESFFFFFLRWTIFKVFIEFVTVLLVFYVLVFWPRGMWDPKLLSCVSLFATPWTAASQASLSFATSQSLIKLTSIESVMPSNHLVRCPPWPAIKSTPRELEGKASSTGPPGKYQVKAFDNFIGFRSEGDQRFTGKDRWASAKGKRWKRMLHGSGHPHQGLKVGQFSSVVSDSLRPHGLQQARLPCPLLTPGAYSNSFWLSQWCHPTISSSVVPFSSCLQSFPASESIPMSHFFTSGGQRIGVSASTSVLPMNI